MFLIEEGSRSRVATVDFEGVQAVPLDALRRALYARARRPFDPAYLVADTAIIAWQEGEHGHLPRVVGRPGATSAIRCGCTWCTGWTRGRPTGSGRSTS